MPGTPPGRCHQRPRHIDGPGHSAGRITATIHRIFHGWYSRPPRPAPGLTAGGFFLPASVFRNGEFLTGSDADARRPCGCGGGFFRAGHLPSKPGGDDPRPMAGHRCAGTLPATGATPPRPPAAAPPGPAHRPPPGGPMASPIGHRHRPPARPDVAAQTTARCEARHGPVTAPPGGP